MTQNPNSPESEYQLSRESLQALQAELEAERRKTTPTAGSMSEAMNWQRYGIPDARQTA